LTDKPLRRYKCKVHKAHLLLVHAPRLSLGVRNLVVVDHQPNLIPLLHSEGRRAICHLGERRPVLALDVQPGAVDRARAAGRLVVDEDVKARTSVVEI
jgi:hypothetical protein